MTARSDRTLINDLRELVDALDRRVPRLEREGEGAIAGEAQALKRAALKRIAELERSFSTATIVAAHHRVRTERVIAHVLGSLDRHRVE